LKPPRDGKRRIGRPRRESGSKRHSGFQDMTGETCGSWVVLSEADPGRDGTVRWYARHACGETHVVTGIRLRSAPPRFCPSCARRRKHADGWKNGRIGEVARG
jgi:hypothetical protein